MTDAKGAGRPVFIAWTVWSVAVSLYVVAVVNRTSLSALGPATQEHFGVGATTLSSFAVLQLVMYAGMQIPVGILLDRFGVTRIVLSGAVLMCIGQVIMAMTDQVWVAILARMLIGTGDACTFISVMRMLVDWFPLRQLPMIGQMTGLIGQAGQIVSVLPLSLAVGVFGWATGFMGVAALGILMLLLGAVVLRDKPGMPTMWERVTGRRGRLTRRSERLLEDGTIGLAAMPATTLAIETVDGKPGFLGNLRRLVALPGVRLAFWVHFTAPFSLSVIMLLWGTPFFTGGVGLSQAEASTVLSVTVVVGLVYSLVFGAATSRFAPQRVPIVIGVVTLIVLVWGVVLLFPGTPPLWLIYVLTLVTAIGGPASMIAFEVMRSYAPRRLNGLVTGLVNMGGFISALIAIFMIGIVLDKLGAGSPETYRLDAFRVAFATQLLLWGLGLVMLVVEYARTNRWLKRHGRS